MPSIRDNTIVLRRLDYSETSQVLVFFGQDRGKVRAIAKGIKRSTKTRHSGAIDLLDAGEVVFSVRSTTQEALAQVTEWKQTRSFSGLREQIPRLYGAQYCAEIVASMTADWDPHPDLYEALLEALTIFNTAAVVLPGIVQFQRQLLQSTGMYPEVRHCVGCGRDPVPGEPLHFTSHQGGILCRDCEPRFVEKRLINPAEPAVLSGRRQGGPIWDAFETFDYHISHLIGRRPSVSEALRSLRNTQ
jgi:DNA repair protein RecO (recombination protein O)